QFGAFSEMDNARKLVIMLEARGYTPNIEEAKVYGNTVYRVRYGAFSSIELARSIEQTCTSQGFNCFVVGL
ncbi:MAG TPA: SPOR domain-containing protein, partial [Desulfomonilia bacterium]|nr:SPOR domain-containing protein [Desulfomonilia bacterium]